MKKIVSYNSTKKEGILLNANESSDNLSELILAEVKENLDNVLFNRYPDEKDNLLYQRYGKAISVSEDKILAGNGSDQMLGYIIQTYLGKGKILYTFNPDFSMYDYYASCNDSEIVKYDLNEDGSIDVKQFIEKGLDNKVDLVIISNPNNPTGHLINKEDVITIVKGFNCPVVIDEAYIEFCDGSVIDEVDKYENLLVTRTLSKAYGLAGIRCGFLITNSKLMAKLRNNFVPYALSSVTQMIAATVLKYADNYKEKVDEIITERDEMYQKIKDFKSIWVNESSANFLYCKAASKKKLMELFDQGKIVIRDYNNEYFRITIGNKEENAKVYKVLENFEKETNL